jgi:Rps23 Pro-64 3,4-dihydroxylase Tpa1-like proline 4-hydroxylase
MFNYTTIENFLTKDECEILLKYSLDNYKLKNAMVGEKEDLNKNARISDVAFINYSEKFPLLSDRFKELLYPHINVKGNELNFENNIYQFTEYKVGEFYDWHVDIGSAEKQKKRYCSVVIQLNDDYDGGELQLKMGHEKNETITLKRGVGNLFVFLSSIIHRVAPVKNGVRYSLVNWFETKPIENYKKTLI